jgi:uncharacterized SAM-binding protein YcdF (DUF218 family)
MGFVLAKTVMLVLSSGALPVLVLAFAVGLLWSRRWRRGRLLVTLIGVALGLLILLPVEVWLNESLEDRFPANPPLPAHVDGIIILGGAVDPHLSVARGQLVLTSAGARLVEGARLARLHPEAKVVFAGGAGDPFRPSQAEAPVAAGALEEFGVAKDRLLLDDASRNTFENAVFAQRLAMPAKGSTWVLVTSARHMPRAMGVFRAVGWPVVAWPVDYSTDGEGRWLSADPLGLRLTRLTEALHEWIGLAFYRLTGRTEQWFPGP